MCLIELKSLSHKSKWFCSGLREYLFIFKSIEFFLTVDQISHTWYFPFSPPSHSHMYLVCWIKHTAITEWRTHQSANKTWETYHLHRLQKICKGHPQTGSLKNKRKVKINTGFKLWIISAYWRLVMCSARVRQLVDLGSSNWAIEKVQNRSH